VSSLDHGGRIWWGRRPRAAPATCAANGSLGRPHHELPILATTSDPKVAENNLGVLGLNTTRTLFGGDGVLGSYRSGARFTVGYAIDELCALESELLLPHARHREALFSSDRTPVIAGRSRSST